MKKIFLVCIPLVFLAFVGCEKVENDELKSLQVENQSAERTDTGPIGARWLDWNGDLDSDCFEGPSRKCIEVIFESQLINTLEVHYQAGTVVSYLNSAQGKSDFPFESNLVSGLTTGNTSFFKFSNGSSVYYAID